MNQIKTNARNGFIDIQKFFYSWIIVIFHFYSETNEHLIGGGTSVEFFLIASGAFFYAGYKKKTAAMDNQQLSQFPVNYIIKLFLRFLPYTFPAFILTFIVDTVIISNGIGVNELPKIIDSLVRHIWDIFLISMCGINGGKSMINGVTWTISAMMLVEFFILNVLTRKEKSFLRFYAPIAVLMGLGMWANLNDLDHKSWQLFTTFGVIRAFIMTCFGIYAWLIAQRLSERKLTTSARVVLTVIEIAFHLIVLFSMTCRSTRYYRMFCALLFAVAISITLSNQSLTAQLFTPKTNRITNFLGELSMTIYVTHWPVRDMFHKFFESPYEFYRTKYVYGIAVLIISLAFLYLGRAIDRAMPNWRMRLKQRFVQKEVFAE